MGIWESVKNRLPAVTYGRKTLYRPPHITSRASHPSSRSFSAAANNNLTSSWGTQPASINSHLFRQLKTIRARSREQSYNNDYARRFVSMAKSNIIGPRGVVLRSQVAFAKGKPDGPARDAVEGAWRRWGRVCDVSGQNNWAQFQRLVLGTAAIDGEAIVRERRGTRHNQFGFGLELVDAELLDVQLNEELPGGHIVRMGVELDEYRKPVAYYFIDPAKSVHNSYYTGSNKHVRVPATEIHHLYLQEYPGQARGLPWMATALLRLMMLGAYEEAALVNARTGASKLGVITSEGGDFSGDDSDDDGPIVDAGEPGSWFQLREGESIDAYDPTYPTGEFPDFVKACLRGIASGLGVHYNILANDLEGVSYSSIRQAVIEDQEIWKCMQDWFTDSFVTPVFDSWVYESLINGAIDINGTPLPFENIWRYKRAAWQPRRWNWIDPLKDVQANIAAIDAGLRSRSDVIREQGNDPEDVWAEIESENELMEEHGVSVAAVEIVEPKEDEDE